MIHTAPRILEGARDRVRPHLRKALETLHPELRHMAIYHFGWSDEQGRPQDGGGGKGVRATLAFLSARAVGMDPEEAIPGAVAIELIHNFGLIHDDIMDGDKERRHRPTVWSLFGVGNAILLGDVLVVLAQQVLLGSASPNRFAASERLTEATLEMIDGQAADLANSSRLGVTLGETITMASQKTAALLECAVTIGAVLGGASESQVEALGSYGRNLGIAFQAVDDVLGIWGLPDRTGKPVGADLREGKMSFPVVAALRRPGVAAERIAALMANGILDEAKIMEATELIEANGGREWTLGEARRRSEAAIEAIESVDLDDDARHDLVSLAAFVTDREF